VPAHALPPHSVWTGLYRCPQGPTALTLTIDVQRGGEATALFVFGPHEGNPTVPRGSYRMAGQAADNHGRMVVKLHPVEWVEQPPTYMMVGLRAESDPAGDVMNGVIDDEQCSSVELQRQR
jgi:hypothetical protein